jgi:hypothetical protein
MEFAGSTTTEPYHLIDRAIDVALIAAPLMPPRVLDVEGNATQPCVALLGKRARHRDHAAAFQNAQKRRGVGADRLGVAVGGLGVGVDVAIVLPAEAGDAHGEDARDHRVPGLVIGDHRQVVSHHHNILGRFGALSRLPHHRTKLLLAKEVKLQLKLAGGLNSTS